MILICLGLVGGDVPTIHLTLNGCLSSQGR